jgi:hypothetical protein
MARRTTRRTRRAWRTWGARAAVLVLLALVLDHRLIWPLVVFAAAVTASAATVMYRRRRRRAVTGRRTAPVRAAATRPARTRTAPADARARRNGWAAPADANAAMAISDECADSACVMCPGAGCCCPCGHDPFVIAAMNTARANRGAVPVPPPVRPPF